MTLKIRISLAAAIAVALSAASTLIEAQTPKSRVPQAGAKTDARGDRTKAKDAATDPNAETPEPEKKDERPDPRTDPKAAQLQLRNMISMGRGRGGMGAGGNPMITLLQNSTPLQEELKFTEKQKASLRAVQSDLRDQMSDVRRQVQMEMGEDFDRQAMFEAMRERSAALMQQGQIASQRVLTPRQRERLMQIELQIEGPVAVAKPEVAQKLRLTPVQQQKIQAVLAEMNGAQQEMRTNAFGGPGGFPFGQRGGDGGAPGRAGPRGEAPTKADAAKTKNSATKKDTARTKAAPGDEENDERPGGRSGFDREEMRERFRRIADQTAKLHDAAEMKIAKILTERQRNSFDKMLGEPFDLTKLTQGGGIMGGRGGPGGFRGGDRGGDGEGAAPTRRGGNRPDEAGEEAAPTTKGRRGTTARRGAGN